MSPKSVVALTALMISTAIFAAHHKLNNYEELKAALLSGKNVKVIVDLNNDCKISDKSHANTFGFVIDAFVIYKRNGTISAGIDSLNAEEMGPFGAAGYSIAGINITPKNEITVESAVVTLPNYKSAIYNNDPCKFSINSSDDGIKFFEM